MSNVDVSEQVARIALAQEETRKFAEEQHKLVAEARKLNRDASLAPWQLIVAFLGAGGLGGIVAAVVLKLLS